MPYLESSKKETITSSELEGINKELIIGKNIRKVGCGGFSEIWEVEINGKRYHRKDLYKAKTDKEKLLKEIYFLNQLDYLAKEVYPQRFGVLETENQYHIYYKIFKGAVLNPSTVIKMSGYEFLRAMQLITEAVVNMHELGVIHNDLKPENIMLIESLSTGKVQILDIGDTLILESGNKAMLEQDKGIFNFVAPEIADNKSYGRILKCRGKGLKDKVVSAVNNIAEIIKHNLSYYTMGDLFGVKNRLPSNISSIRELVEAYFRENAHLHFGTETIMFLREYFESININQLFVSCTPEGLSSLLEEDSDKADVYSLARILEWSLSLNRHINQAPFNDLINSMTNIDATKRPSSQEVLYKLNNISADDLNISSKEAIYDLYEDEFEEQARKGDYVHNSSKKNTESTEEFFPQG